MCAAVVSASAAAAATPDRLDAPGAAGPIWTFDQAIANPTGATPSPGWTVSGSTSSLTVTRDIYPEKPDSTAQAQFEATWEAPPQTLTPGSRFEMPVTVTGRVSGGRDEQFFTGLDATALQDGAWNRDAVGVSVSCVDEPASVVCTDPATTTGTLTYSIPTGGDRFSIGVGALNCGDACDTEWFYVWTEEPATPPATEPAIPTDTDWDNTDRVSSTELLEQLSEADIEEAEVLKAAWTVVADEYLGGRNSVAALVVLRDIAEEYFDDRIRHAENNYLDDAASLFRAAQAERLAELDADIKAAKDRELAEDQTQLGVIHQVLVDGADSIDPDDPPEPDERVQAVINDLHDDESGQSVTDALNSQLIHAVDDNELTDDAPPPTEPTAAPTTTLPAPPPTITTPPPTATTRPPTTDASLDLRPLRFTNSGFVPVGVRAETYDPAPDLEWVTMSRASTIVFPDTNPSSYLDLPRGTYTFCYDWEVGMDDDRDGLVDEAHAFTRAITLDRDTPDDPLLAPVMTLNPDTGGTPGNCGGDRPPSADQLTLKELAARATATYQVACTYDDGTTTNYQKTYWFEFTDDGADWWELGADIAVTLLRLDNSSYLVETDQTVWLEFTDEGFDLWGGGVGELQNCFAARET